jgi:CubicO group peptidase (beta-lactamase class C family)
MALLGMGVPLAASQEAGPVGSTRWSEAIRASREAVTGMMQRARVPGVSVAVAVKGEVVWAEGFGFADLEHEVPATAHTRFGIGSNSKSLTTALLGRLMEEGLLDLDAPVERYLPEFPHAGKGVTIERVAAHLSGLDDTFSAANAHSNVHYPTTDAALREVLREPLKYPPGQRSSYATGTYTILAAVVERVTGEPFLSALERRILQPLQLRNTVPNDRRAIVPHRTSFYAVDEGDRLVHAPFFDPSFKWAGAGYLSTAEDLARFGSAHLGPGFFRAETLQRILTSLRTTAGEDTGLGLGWRIGADAGFGMNWTIGPDGWEVRGRRRGRRQQQDRGHPRRLCAPGGLDRPRRDGRDEPQRLRPGRPPVAPGLGGQRRVVAGAGGRVRRRPDDPGRGRTFAPPPVADGPPSHHLEPSPRGRARPAAVGGVGGRGGELDGGVRRDLLARRSSDRRRAVSRRDPPSPPPSPISPRGRCGRPPSGRWRPRLRCCFVRSRSDRAFPAGER